MDVHIWGGARNTEYQHLKAAPFCHFPRSSATKLWLTSAEKHRTRSCLPCRTMYHGWHLTWGNWLVANSAHEPIASVSHALYDIALVLGQLTHAIIACLPPFSSLRGGLPVTARDHRSRRFVGGMNDELPISTKYKGRVRDAGFEAPCRLYLVARRDQWRNQRISFDANNSDTCVDIRWDHRDNGSLRKRGDSHCDRDCWKHGRHGRAG